MKARIICLLLVASGIAFSTPAHAFIFHEHYEIGAHVLRDLSPETREGLRRVWAYLRKGYGEQLCPKFDQIELDADGDPRCIDLAAFPAIAADHSCSPNQMFRFAMEEAWIIDVLEIADDTRQALDESSSPQRRIDYWNFSNLRFQRADPFYATRAGANFAHFPQHRTTPDYARYIKEATAIDVPINATYLYAAYHIAAMRIFAEAKETTDEQSRATLILEALTAEMFALHFLQDAFSAGHVVGQWGGPAIAKGTHDHYSIHGLPAFTWEGEAYGALGDAHMAGPDLEHATRAMRASLEHFLREADDPRLRARLMKEISLREAVELRNIDSCQQERVAWKLPDTTLTRSATTAWSKTLMPSTGSAEIHLPRFQSEIGVYFGFMGGGDLGMAFAGYETPAEGSPRPTNGLSAYLNLGLGLEGAIGQGADGAVVLGLGSHAVGPQFDGACSDCPTARGHGAIIPRVPARLAPSLRLRMPFWILPFDVLVVAPIIAIFDLDTAATMAIIAASGGIIPWQRVFFTGAGELQIIAGREARASLFGIGAGDGFVRDNPDGTISGLTFRSVMLDFPLFEWRPLRSYSSAMTGAMVTQFGGTVDVPYDVKTEAGDETSLAPSFSFYLRVLFDGRFFL